MTVATQTTAIVSDKSFGYTENLRPFDYLTWKQLRKLAGESDDIRFAEPIQWDKQLSKTDYKGNLTEAYFLKLLSFLAVEEVKLAPHMSKLDSYLKIDIVMRLGENEAIALQVKSCEYNNQAFEDKYRKEKVFLVSKDNKRQSYPAPASVWADVKKVKGIELLAFLSNKLGVPVSTKTKVLFDRYKLLRQLAKGSKLSVTSALFKTLKISSDEIYNLSFLKLLKVEGGTICFV